MCFRMRLVRSIWLRDTKCQLNCKEKDGYRAESEKGSCVKYVGQITEEREK